MSQKKPLIETKTNYFDINELAINDYSLNHSVDDDKAYLDYDIWAQLPRGKAYVVEHSTGNIIHKLHGVPKFGADNVVYGPGLDETWDTIVFTEKANGEAFHVSAFRYNGSNYVIGGSKNVHILVNLDKDIEKQFIDIAERQPKRATYAIKMTKAFLALPNYKNVVDYCIKEGVSFVGEYINPEHEHIVDYDREHILFFAITHPDKQYTWCTPIEANQIFNKLGVESVEIIVGDKSNVDQIKLDYYNRRNSEGAVIYYIKDNRTIYMQKYKNKQYTLLRTVREMFNSGAGVNKLVNRLNDYHLVLTDEDKKDYINFFMWLKQNKSEEEPFSIRLWYKYIKTGKVIRDSDRKVVLLVGMPGSGKTTVGTQLAIQMSLEGNPATYIDQDLYKSNPKFLANAFREIIHDKPIIKTVFHGKTNATTAIREQSLAPVTTESLYVVYIESNPQESIKRITDRQFHYNLKANDPKLKQIVTGFKQSLQIPTNDEFSIYPNFKGIITLSAEKTVLEKVNAIAQFIGFNKSIDKLLDMQWSSYIGIKVNRYWLENKIEPIHKEHTKPIGLKKQEEYHITLIHSNDYAIYPQLFLDLQKHVGNKANIVALDYVYNNRIAAVEVNIELPAVNEHTHITYARAEGVSPYESNELLANPNSNRVVLGNIELEDGVVTLF